MAMASISHDILICGHTHIPYSKKYGNKLLVNSGSVGKPKNGTPHATYAELTFSATPKAQTIEVEYSFHKTVEHILQHDLPEKNTLALIYGK
jgi:predicted phosphodiesterase